MGMAIKVIKMYSYPGKYRSGEMVPAEKYIKIGSKPIRAPINIEFSPLAVLKSASAFLYFRISVIRETKKKKMI